MPTHPAAGARITPNSGAVPCRYRFGPIGQEVAKRVKAFGATTTIIRRTPTASPLADAVGTMADMPALVGKADVIVLACSLNASTRGFANAGFFAPSCHRANRYNVPINVGATTIGL